MIRLLGAITGSALALAGLLVFVGIPQFKAEPVNERAAVTTLPLPTAAVDAPPAADAAAPDEADPPAAPETESANPAPATAAESAPPAATSDEPADSNPLEALSAEESRQWYAFWSPFRSEVAANGFVEQLQRVTGLDYRVVKVKPGVYEVAFAYADGQDLEAQLSTISAATGLELQAWE